MSELREGYVTGRILIAAERMETPQFDAMGIYLSGEQVEMLRNVVHYLSRRTTWVDAYADAYYTMPGDEDWDSILAIIADMEDKLMANENTLWGYHDRWVQSDEIRLGTDGNYVKVFDAVPEGWVYVLQSASIKNAAGVRGWTYIRIKDGTNVQTLFNTKTPLTGIADIWCGDQKLAEGDVVEIRQNNCLENDDITAVIWGYKMVVPV